MSDDRQSGTGGSESTDSWSGDPDGENWPVPENREVPTNVAGTRTPVDDGDEAAVEGVSDGSEDPSESVCAFLEDLEDGCGCAEVRESLSERRG